MFNNILDKNIRIFQAVRLVILTDKVVKWRKMENEHNSDMATPQKRLSDTHKHIFPLCFFFVKERTSFTNLPISMPTTIHIFDMITSQRRSGPAAALLHSHWVQHKYHWRIAKRIDCRHFSIKLTYFLHLNEHLP